MTPLGSTPTILNFKKLCEELSLLIEKEGWSVRPYSEPSMQYFKQLSPGEREWTTNRLTDYLEICRQVHGEGHPIKDARVLVRRGLQHFHFLCNMSVEKMIEAKHVVEFYGLDHRQIFRTFNYFEFTSYTVEDIYCRQWYHLYERDEAVTNKLMSSVEPLIAGQVSEPIYFHHQEHIMQERDSLEKLRFWAKEVCITPLTQGPNLRAYLNIIQVRPFI